MKKKVINKGDHKPNALRSFLEKVLKTVCYFLGFITIGYYYTISGLTLGLIQKNTGTSESIAGLIMTFRGVGLLSTVLFTGWIYNAVKVKSDYTKNHIRYFFAKIVNLHTIINSASILISVCLILVPFVTNIYILFVIHFFIGVGSSFIEIGCYVGITAIWRKKVDVVSQLIQAFFGIGNLVFPIIISQIFEFFDTSKMQLTSAYLVCGTMCYIPSVLFFFITPPPIYKVKTKKLTFLQAPESAYSLKDLKKKEEKKKSINLIKLFSLKNLLMILTGLLKCFFLAVQIGFSGLLFSYCQRLKLDTDANLAILTSVYYIAFTISRFSSGFITIFIRPIFILALSVVGSTNVFILFLFFGDNLIAVWILSILFAFLAAPGSAGTLVMLQSSFGVRLTALATSFLMFGQFVGEMSGVTIMTTLSDDALLGVKGIPIISLILIAISLIIYFSIVFFGLIYNKFDPERKKFLQREKEQKRLKKEKKKISKTKVVPFGEEKQSILNTHTIQEGDEW